MFDSKSLLCFLSSGIFPVDVVCLVTVWLNYPQLVYFSSHASEVLQFLSALQLLTELLLNLLMKYSEVTSVQIQLCSIVLTLGLYREVISLFPEVITQLMFRASATWGQIPSPDPRQVFTFPAGYHCIESKILLEKYPVLISRYQVISCAGSPGKLFQWLISLANFLSPSVRPGS